MMSKSAQMKFQAIKDYYFRKGNMYMNEGQCLCWVDNPAQKPKDIVYKKISPEESKKIADENAAFEAKFSKIDLSEIDASLDAEVVEVLKDKENPIIVKKEGWAWVINVYGVNIPVCSPKW